jgi:hypothetical protein
MTYTAVFAAPDGAYVHEGTFDTTDEANEYVSNVGSRWIFYPLGMIADAESHEIVSARDDYNSILDGVRYDDLTSAAGILTDLYEIYCR